MDPWRGLKQIGLLIVLISFVGSVWLVFYKIFGKVALGWLATLGILTALIGVSILILRTIFRSAYLPTPEQVQSVVVEIEATLAGRIESYKGKLHFFFPPHWRTCKIGKEGYVLRPKGLGVPVAFSIWATTKNPKFNDNSFQGMVKNAQDLAQREGGQIQINSIISRQIAGIDGIEYIIIDQNGHHMLEFFWCYENGDYQVLIDASSSEHLSVIRPAVDAFLRYCYME